MIYFLRHGLDDEDFIGGWSDGDLIDVGVKQIEKSSDYIFNNLSVKSIISSDINRALSTANIVNSKLKLSIKKDKRLRELNKGIYTGVLKSSLENDIKLYIKNMSIYDKYPDGESMFDFYKRIESLIPSLYEYEDSLVVTHRGVINMLYYYFNNVYLDMDKEKFGVVHGSIHELDLDKGVIRRIY